MTLNQIHLKLVLLELGNLEVYSVKVILLTGPMKYLKRWKSIEEAPQSAFHTEELITTNFSDVFLIKKVLKTNKNKFQTYIKKDMVTTSL